MTTKPLIKKSMDEQQIDCEVAAEVLAEYLAFCARELSMAKALDCPDSQRIKALEKHVRELKKEKLLIGVDNIDVINKAIYVYAPLLKKRACTVY